MSGSSGFYDRGGAEEEAGSAEIVVLGAGRRVGTRKPYETDVARVAGEADAVLEVQRWLPFEQWRPIFLRVFEATGNVAGALRAAHIARSTLKEHLESSPQFRQQYEEARDSAIDSLELEAWKRARNGSDFLLWRLMQSLRPDVYGDRRTVEHKFSQSERREAYALAKKEGLSDTEAREAVAQAEEMLRQSRGRGS